MSLSHAHLVNDEHSVVGDNQGASRRWSWYERPGACAQIGFVTRPARQHVDNTELRSAEESYVYASALTWCWEAAPSTGPRWQGDVAAPSSAKPP